MHLFVNDMHANKLFLENDSTLQEKFFDNEPVLPLRWPPLYNVSYLFPSPPQTALLSLSSDCQL